MKPKPKVLLVGWDAADWEHIHPLLDEGKLPNLQRLVDGGTIGNLATLQPVLSPMLWNSVSTGKQPFQHGVHGFMEPDPVHGGARPWSSQTRKTKAIWNILSQSGLSANVVNWWASYPAEPVNGCIVANMLQCVDRKGGEARFPSASVHPPELSDYLASLVVEPHELSSQQVAAFVPNCEQIDQTSDNRLSILVKHLADMISTHAVATAVMAETSWDFMAVYYTAIDHFCHSFVSYHPPRLPWVKEDDFEMYKNVINATYQFSDMTLGRLMHLAGPDTTVIVCSDHGFQSGSGRLAQTPNEPAGPAYWHRKYGVFMAAGPGIQRDERVYGATLLDITPTILNIFGLPVGEDMKGRVLAEIFESPPKMPVESVPSWDDVESDQDGRLRDEIDVRPEESEALFRQFVAMGYVEDPGESKADQHRFAHIEAQFNLARNLHWCRHFGEAIEIFAELVRADSWEDRYILHLTRSLIAGGRPDDARRLLEDAYQMATTRNIQALVLWAETLCVLGQNEECLDALRAIEGRRVSSIGVDSLVATCYMKIRHFEDASRLFESIVERQPDTPEALLALSTIALHRRDNQRAADLALASIGLLYNQIRAHNNLGVAFARSEQFDRAEVAFQTALRIAPGSLRAHRHLRNLYAGPLKNPSKADMHLLRIDELTQQRSQRNVRRTAETPPPIDWGTIPDESERARILNERRPPQVNIAKPSGKTFTIVSGLPRSGTSLMMQMLDAGGLPAKTDGQRVADVDNPKGYLEWEAIKGLARKPQLFNEDGLDTKAIKVVAPLLPHLPYQHHYKVIFMDRAIEEVVASQRRMVQRLSEDGEPNDEKRMKAEMGLHRRVILAWLDEHPRAEACVIRYRDLLEEPESCIQEISRFLGDQHTIDPESMLAAIDPSLYRNRSTSPRGPSPMGPSPGGPSPDGASPGGPAGSTEDVGPA